MYLIVGLGNPGIAYLNTRHNVGFCAVDHLADKLNIAVNRYKHKALVGEGFVSGKKVMLAKPQTYMNLSGESVQELMAYYKVDLAHLVVLYDDIDLEIGALRIRGAGSAGTHNGMRSVIACLGEDDFARIRIGVGRQQTGRDLASYVLSKPDQEEQALLATAYEQAADAVLLMIQGKLADAQAKYNKRKKPKQEQQDTTISQQEG